MLILNVVLTIDTIKQYYSRGTSITKEMERGNQTMYVLIRQAGSTKLTNRRG